MVSKLLEVSGNDGRVPLHTLRAKLIIIQDETIYGTIELRSGLVKFKIN